jgi:RNA polymerase sigma-70 factor (ECF subfamily)
MTADDDAEAITASWRDPERFTVLFDRHAPHIHRYLARRVGQDEADDLLGETFLTAFAKRRGYDPAYRDARPWLYGIATNLVARYRRAEAQRFRLLRAASPRPDLPDFSERATAALTASSVRRELTAALADVPDGDRDVLLLVAWADLTYDEVARALGIPLGTVRSRLHRARSRLRIALTDIDYKEILSQ